MWYLLPWLGEKTHVCHDVIFPLFLLKLSCLYLPFSSCLFFFPFHAIIENFTALSEIVIENSHKTIKNSRYIQTLKFSLKFHNYKNNCLFPHAYHADIHMSILWMIIEKINPSVNIKQNSTLDMREGSDFREPFNIHWNSSSTTVTTLMRVLTPWICENDDHNALVHLNVSMNIPMSYDTFGCRHHDLWTVSLSECKQIIYVRYSCTATHQLSSAMPLEYTFFSLINT